MWLRVCREKNARVGARDAESTGRVVLSLAAAQPGREISPGGGGRTTLSGGSRSGEISEFQGGRQGRVSDENHQGNAGAHRALIPDSSERSLAHVTHQTNPGPLSTPPLTPQSVSAPAPLAWAQPDVGAGTLPRSQMPLAGTGRELRMPRPPVCHLQGDRRPQPGCSILVRTHGALVHRLPRLKAQQPEGAILLSWGQFFLPAAAKCLSGIHPTNYGCFFLEPFL